MSGVPGFSREELLRMIDELLNNQSQRNVTVNSGKKGKCCNCPNCPGPKKKKKGWRRTSFWDDLEGTLEIMDKHMPQFKSKL